MNKRQKRKHLRSPTTAKVRRRNKALCERYPFLIPRSVWTDKITWDMKPKDEKYSYTLLEELPNGWRKAFGLQMCEEIRTALLRSGGKHKLQTYRVTQIKEKYGGLRWYDYGGNNEVSRIIDDYEVISQNICIKCGKPDVPMINESWISPWCEECWLHRRWNKDATHEDYINLCDEDDGILRDSYKIRVYFNGNVTEVTRDIGDKVAKIRARYRA